MPLVASRLIGFWLEVFNRFGSTLWLLLGTCEGEAGGRKAVVDESLGDPVEGFDSVEMLVFMAVVSSMTFSFCPLGPA